MNHATASAPATADTTPRQAALAALAASDLTEGSVRYQSRGRVLVIGDTARALACAERLPELPERVLLVNARSPSPPGQGTRLFVAAVEAVEGHLGRFSVRVAATDRGGIDLATVCGGGFFDTVIDLQPQPALSMEALPPGYFAPGVEADLEPVLEQVRGLVGSFEKPKYVHYDPAQCLHGAHGQAGCTRCLAVCPAWAIGSLGERITIDYDRCHGIGSCASACPTGAIRYELPRPESFNARIREALRRYRGAGGQAACLLFHDAGAGGAQLELLADTLPEQVVPVELEELATAGLETWLSALAWGAADVWLYASTDTHRGAFALLEREVSLGRHLLEGIGYDPDALRLFSPLDDQALLVTLEARPERPERRPAAFAAVPEKRSQLRLALDHLVSHGVAVPPVVPLPEGAPFGTVALDIARCTLCMACVSGCRVNALSDGGERPKLNFLEANCIQCGLCESVCPEGAITLRPRLLTNGLRRQQPRTLKEESPFECIRCGKPFATQGAIARVLERLASHAMFQGDDRERLKMCEDCRVRAIFDEHTQPTGERV